MFVVSFLPFAPAIFAQTLAITFDDGFDATQGNSQAVEDNAAILAALKQQKVRAMLFPAGVVADNAENMALVRAWSQAGHLIGNHTYKHESLSQTDTALYFDDVLRAQNLLQVLPGWCPRLRFPYLDEGGDDKQRNLAYQWLAQHDYGVAAVTIALPDWDFARHYLETLQSGSEHQAMTFRQDYLQQLWAQAQTQEANWRKELGRSPPHVLLLHANHLNAAILPDLLQLLKENGWHVIDPLTAFQDPIYQRHYVPNGTPKVDEPTLLPIPACR
ncbi:polysaccharide deacetylase family protein [Pusillimonas sp. CC-YST705]|uniref:Polysaccharide deacetylase family protein n=1 Tax=Mesopusillimonas faecipullorum TaxID=2755040 RepID=A0ABS8CEX6_9BURK|nr:polysaccharide deacetylase family protein [Mesopusillimonas faecipullorum]MCB5364558.1 polysaccharide deacetylase family protein [Mesopusillimonas faecipullorum]